MWCEQGADPAARHGERCAHRAGKLALQPCTGTQQNDDFVVTESTAGLQNRLRPNYPHVDLFYDRLLRHWCAERANAQQ